MYRVSHFGHFYGTSPLFLTLAGCGFRDSVLLFCETEDGMALLVFAIQGGNGKYHFLITPCISVVLELGEMVETHSYRFFSVESSGVVSFSIKLSVFELLSKHMFFQMGHPIYYFLFLLSTNSATELYFVL